MKRYLEKSIENMRDIGGYICGNNLKIRYSCLIRSNLPNNISTNDIRFLKNLNIKDVIDLRSLEEVKNKPSVFENNKDFNVFHIEIIGGREIPESSEKVPISYINMLEQKDKIKEIFEILKTKEKILYFCNAGKDRTGVITTLILQTLGANKKDIINDYILTKKYMENSLKKYTTDKELLTRR